jgi:predicted dehydrogenase
MSTPLSWRPPHSLHEEQIIAAAGADKHIFCEKPFCLTRASALRAMEAVEKAGVQVAIGHERRFEPPIMDAMALARDGKLGALMHIEANFSHDIFAVLDDTNWRLKTDQSPAGGLTATLIHLMDLSISLFGQPDRVLASVECHGDVVKNGDTLTAQVKFENGRTASLNAFTHTPFFSRLAIFGANGWVEVRDKAHVQAPEGWFFTTCFTDGKAETVEYEVATPVLSNLECFADAIAGKADYPNTPEQIVRNMSLLEAIVKSATTDELVRIER